MTDAGPTRAHLIADTALAVVSFAAAADGHRPVAALARHPREGAALALLAVVIAGLLALVLGARAGAAAA